MHDFSNIGLVEKMTPALHTNYEVYKSVSHTLLHVGVLVAPFLRNPEATAWKVPLGNYLRKVDLAIEALHKSESAHLKKDLLLSMLGDASAFLHSCMEKSRDSIKYTLESSRKSSRKSSRTQI